MESLYLLIPLGVVVIVCALLVFLWAVRSGQFDALDQQQDRMPDDEP